MNETLKQIRINALQYSEKDMAIKLDMSLSDYKKIEDITPIDINLLSKLAKAVGKPIENLIDAQKQELKFDIDDAFQTVDEFKNKLNGFVKQSESTEGSPNLDLHKLLNTVNKTTRKPRVAFVGRSDVGKSSLINTLIGSKTLPEAWTPTTSIIVYVKHSSDKPKYCSNNVMVFKSDENTNIWDDTKLSDQEYTKSFCIAEGDYKILEDYGARQGSKFEDSDASSAVVFVESDILNNCDLIDLPGYGTKDREEDDSLLKKNQNVDVLVYMSVANGFMRGDDINWLQGELPNLAPIALNNRQLKPLSNLYIVASQAHTVSNGSIDALETILQKGADRFEKTLSSNYWNNLGQDTTSNDFRCRFFTYSKDQESLRTKFENDLRSLLIKLPEIIKNSVVDYVKEYVKNAKTCSEKELRSSREILSKREEKKKEIEEIKAKEPQRINDNENRKANIIKKIKDLSHEASVDITNCYNKILTVENIIKIIEKNYWSNKEEDNKQLSAKLSNLLNDSYISVLKNYSKELSEDIDKFLENLKSSITMSLNKDGVDVGANFNVKVSFITSLEGAATCGALSVWASSLGKLGTSILVSKGVSVLSAMGISLGGTTAAYAAIAVLGGSPVVLAIRLAAILASFVYVLFLGDRRIKIAKRIIKEYDKNKVLSNYLSQNSKYWSDTEVAFSTAANKLEKDFEDYIASLDKDINTSDDDNINLKIVSEERKIRVYDSLLKNL
ncbi:dynamin family protein [Prevotella koreensis]